MKKEIQSFEKNASNNTARSAASSSDSAHCDFDYWKDRLAHYPEPLALPLDYPRTQRGASARGVISFDLAPAQVSALDRLSKQAGVSRFSTLLAAWSLVLHRLGSAAAENVMVVAVRLASTGNAAASGSSMLPLSHPTRRAMARQAGHHGPAP